MILSMSQFATRLDFETAQAEHSGKKIALYQTEGAFVPVGGSATVIIDDHHKVGHNGIRPGYLCDNRISINTEEKDQ